MYEFGWYPGFRNVERSFLASSLLLLTGRRVRLTPESCVLCPESCVCLYVPSQSPSQTQSPSDSRLWSDE